MSNTKKITIEIDKEELSIISQALIYYSTNWGYYEIDEPQRSELKSQNLKENAYTLHERMEKLLESIK